MSLLNMAHMFRNVYHKLYTNFNTSTPQLLHPLIYTNGRQMVRGDGFSVAFDITDHDCQFKMLFRPQAMSYENIT